jgi:hypothetical protein
MNVVKAPLRAELLTLDPLKKERFDAIMNVVERFDAVMGVA